MKVINRIKDSKDFARTIKNGKTVKNQSFVIHYSASDLDHISVGISVSKKIGNAVIRNRVKRQLRAMCDSIIDYKMFQLDIVIIARADFLSKSFADNKFLLKNLLENQIRIKNEEK